MSDKWWGTCSWDCAAGLAFCVSPPCMWAPQRPWEVGDVTSPFLGQVTESPQRFLQWVPGLHIGRQNDVNMRSLTLQLTHFASILKCQSLLGLTSGSDGPRVHRDREGTGPVFKMLKRSFPPPFQILRWCEQPKSQKWHQHQWLCQSRNWELDRGHHRCTQDISKDSSISDPSPRNPSPLQAPLQATAFYFLIQST